ncbi:MAG: inorganic phosphate transporter [Chloroflexi bacterium]|nr:inorganic phosphate transporter [Chloroflexota bacterium]
MSENSFAMLLLVIVLAIGFDLVNGWTDAPNAIATVVSTRVMPPTAAVLMAGTLNVLGAFVSTKVAKTIGSGILDKSAVTLPTIMAALAAVIIWGSAAWYFGLPISKSHGLIAALAGAGMAAGGISVLLWAGWRKVFEGIGFSTFLGFGTGLILIVAIYWIVRNMRPALVRNVFGRLQILSAAFMAFSHGTNDAQKTMGVITLALAVHYGWTDFKVPLWVIFLSACVIGFGTFFGAWRVVKTLGIRLTKLEPVHGFAAETGAGIVIQAASHFGIPLSTTHVIGTSIMGVGASRRLSAVRWGVAGNIVSAWILTFPICGVLAFVLSKLFNLAFR